MRLRVALRQLEGRFQRRLGGLEGRDLLFFGIHGRGGGDKTAAQAPEDGLFIGIVLQEVVELPLGELEVLAFVTVKVEAVDLGQRRAGARGGRGQE